MSDLVRTVLGGSACLAVAACSAPAPVTPAPASLTNLRFDGFTLQPAFSPDVHDYTLPCAAGTNVTTLSATATAGVTLDLIRPQATAITQPIPLALVENDAVVVSATLPDDTTADYWVRCLPHDYPPVVLHRLDATAPGYYVTGIDRAASNGADAAYAMVLDGNGVPVWYRPMGAGNVAGLVTVVGPNEIAFMSTVGGRFGTDPAQHFTVLDLATGVTSDVATIAGATDAHELLPLSNGDYMLLSYPATSGVDMSARGVGNTTTIADCSVQEIAPDGTMVWSWLGSEHFDAVEESTELATGSIDGASVIDPFHCNSIDVTPSGDVLLSARQLDAVVLVSRATGKIAWKLGGTAYSKDGAQLIQLEGDPETSFYHQHDARLLPDGDISLYDDHTTQYDTQSPPPGPARGLEIRVDVQGGRASIVWQYVGVVSAQATGSFRRYADGSSVVGWGYVGGVPALAATEVDGNGSPLLDLSFALGDETYRVLKIPSTMLDLDTLRQAAGE